MSGAKSITLTRTGTSGQSLQRFDARSDAVGEEANAIGTAHLRAELTPPSVCEPAQSLMREYVDLRVQDAAVSLAKAEEGSLVEQAQLKSALKANPALKKSYETI